MINNMWGQFTNCPKANKNIQNKTHKKPTVGAIHESPENKQKIDEKHTDNARIARMQIKMCKNNTKHIKNPSVGAIHESPVNKQKKRNI